MARFVFRLAGVLRHREMLEQERQRELAVVAGARAVIQAELKSLDETVQGAMADLRANRLTGTLDLSFLAAHRRFMLAMSRQGADAMQRLAAAQQKVDVAQAALAAAAKDRKIIEKLKEKQEARWAEAIAKKEMDQLDEVSMQMAFEAAMKDEAAETEMPA